MPWLQCLMGTKYLLCKTVENAPAQKMRWAVMTNMVEVIVRKIKAKVALGQIMFTNTLLPDNVLVRWKDKTCYQEICWPQGGSFQAWDGCQHASRTCHTCTITVRNPDGSKKENLPVSVEVEEAGIELMSRHAEGFEWKLLIKVNNLISDLIQVWSWFNFMVCGF